jgi:hypothetical protein
MSKLMNRLLLILLLMTIVVSSCNYSFTGASISPEVKTISIGYIKNNAPLINPMLSQNFTDALKDKFVGQTNLMLKDKDGDLQIEGEITDYNTQPIAIQGGVDKAALNRLTVIVKIKFTNRLDAKQNFEQNFSRFQDYSSSKNLRDVEDGLVKLIDNDLVEDIFNKAIVNW